jgi:hypothetical protein
LGSNADLPSVSLNSVRNRLPAVRRAGLSPPLARTSRRC